jgi:hypothetical protein
MLLSACDPNFDPDWKVPVPSDDGGSIDAGSMSDGGALTDAEGEGDADADADTDAAPAPDGSTGMDAAQTPDSGVIIVPALSCVVVPCADAGDTESCPARCAAPCALSCQPDEPCTAVGLCTVACFLCAQPPIK